MNGVLRKDVMAFRFEPHTAPGMLTIDGEEVYYGPLQCQIHPTQPCIGNEGYSNINQVSKFNYENYVLINLICHYC